MGNMYDNGGIVHPISYDQSVRRLSQEKGRAGLVEADQWWRAVSIRPHLHVGWEYLCSGDIWRCCTIHFLRWVLYEDMEFWYRGLVLCIFKKNVLSYAIA